jgi:uncharacterized protein involved in response to NO
LDLSFSVMLAVVVAKEVIAARNLRNLLLLGPLMLLGVANVYMHLETAGVALAGGIGWRLAVAVVAILVSIIAGRVISTFTRHWLVARQATRVPPNPGKLD